MSLRDRITEALSGVPDASVLVAFHGGLEYPPLTDYFLRPIPDSWNAAPLPELVGSMTLLPVFTNADCYSIYCLDMASGRFFAIDPEAPWPPTRVFPTCLDFRSYLFDVANQDRPIEVKNRLRELLGITQS